MPKGQCPLPRHGAALALKMRPTTTPSRSTSKSLSFHLPDWREADACLRISVWSSRHPLRCLDMYGMKSLLSAFDVKAHRIDRRVGAGQHIGNHPLVSSVDRDRRRHGSSEPKSLRLRSGSNGKLVLAEMSNDAAAEKAGSTEDGDDADTHRENDGKVETPPVATKPSTSRKVTAEFRLESEPADRSCGRFCSP